jgi:3-hydroxypropanoate dehydrogenase
MTAPVTAIVAFDEKFYLRMPELFPLKPAMGEMLAKMPNSAEFIMRNGSLQGGYLILAARALGLDCGPMSGFDNAKLDAEFFAETSWKSNFLCNLGYGDASKLFPRLPRLPFDEACQLA